VIGGDDETETETGSFADLAEGIDGLEPLEPGRRVPPNVTEPSQAPRQAGEGVRAGAPSPLYFPDPNEPLLARHSSIRHRTLVRLRRGEISQRVRIDLHRDTLATAKRCVIDGLLAASGPGEACALIVHGKGHHSPEGVARLKAALPAWLCDAALESRVLGFAPAQPRDGGSGAVYVLLAPTVPSESE
jgi:DNA-nicking Smr family endonuclease